MFSKNLRCQYIYEDGRQCEKLAIFTTWISSMAPGDDGIDTCFTHCNSVIPDGEKCVLRSLVYVEGE